MPKPVEWIAYDRWNEAIADEFFSGSFGGKPVYLDLEEDSLRRIAEAAGAESEEPAAALIAVVRPTVAVHERRSLFAHHIDRVRRWNYYDGRPSTPPVLTILAFLSLVAEQMRDDGSMRASNYYGRFLQLLGADADDAHLRQKVIRGFSDQSHDLWRALNSWLEEDSAIRGISTAFAFDHRVHVSRPMSQALVRDGDRQALRRLFADVGFSPGQSIAPEDMGRILQSWLPDAASTSLKRLCNDEETLRRVAEVACVELESWTGEVTASVGGGTERVAITASIRRIPRQSLRLNIAVRAPEEIDTLTALDGVDDAGKAALSPSDGTLSLAPLDAAGWRPAATPLAIADLLLSRLTLVSGDFLAKREPKPIVALGRDEGSSLYHEVSRVRLGGEHLILAVESVRPRLERELDLIARQGYTVHERMPGLPETWVLYEGVEIAAISETQAPDLSVLIPLAWTEVTVEGGLKLPGRGTWHSASPPEIRASTPPDREVSVLLVRERDDIPGGDLPTEAEMPPDEPALLDPSTSSEQPQTTEADVGPETADPTVDTLDDDSRPPTETERLAGLIAPNEELVTVLGTFEGALVSNLRERELAAGDYRVRLLSASDDLPLSSTAVHLRSATAGDAPSPTPEPPPWPLRAVSAEPFEGPTSVLDHAVSHETEIEETPRSSVDIPQCYLSGAHYFVLEAAGRERPRYGQTVDGACRYCGLEKSFPARPSRGRGNGPLAQGRRERARKRIPPREARTSVDHDVVLDALSFLGEGTADQLTALVAQYETAPWTASSTLQTLSALGHLDLSVDTSMRPARWRIREPAIAVTPTRCFLMGWRSEELLHRLGCEIETQWSPSTDAPTRVGFETPDDESLADLAIALANAAGRTVDVVHNPAQSLLAALPPLQALRPSLPRIDRPPIDGPLERLNDQLRWERTDAATGKGSFRTARFPRVAWHRDGLDNRRVNARLAKWLDRPVQDIAEIDAQNQQLVCVRGAEPPGLYERALVLWSGQPCLAAEGHIVMYEGVPPVFAESFLARMARG